MDIRNEICKIFVENNVSEEQIDDETLLREVGINSLSFIKIAVEIENRFNVSFPEEKLLLDEFDNFRSLLDYVSELIKSK